MMSPGERERYLEDLRVAVNARSVWLFRDFIERWGPAIGPLRDAARNRCDDVLLDLMGEISAAFRAESDHQLACQFIAPWTITT